MHTDHQGALTNQGSGRGTAQPIAVRCRLTRHGQMQRRSITGWLFKVQPISRLIVDYLGGFQGGNVHCIGGLTQACQIVVRTFVLIVAGSSSAHAILVLVSTIGSFFPVTTT